MGMLATSSTYRMPAQQTNNERKRQIRGVMLALNLALLLFVTVTVTHLRSQLISDVVPEHNALVWTRAENKTDNNKSRDMPYERDLPLQRCLLGQTHRSSRFCRRNPHQRRSPLPTHRYFRGFDELSLETLTYGGE